MWWSSLAIVTVGGAYFVVLLALIGWTPRAEPCWENTPSAIAARIEAEREAAFDTRRQRIRQITRVRKALDQTEPVPSTTTTVHSRR